MKKTNCCVWLKPPKSKIRDKNYFLNRALFFYYNQYPNYNTYLKAGPIYNNLNIIPNSLLDKCPDFYYSALYN